MNVLVLFCALQVTIVTDASWQGSDASVPGWEKAATKVDWPAARIGEGREIPASHGARYTIENMFGFASKAEWIVAGDGASCVLRRVIEVPKGFRRAELVMVADDVATVMVNGETVSKWDTKQAAWGQRGGAGLVDLVPYLVEGKNVIGVLLLNDRGPWGFAAELRIDGEPVVLPVRGAGQKLPESVAKRVHSLVPSITGIDTITRFGAETELMQIAERHGGAMVPVLKELSGSGTAEVAEAASRILSKVLPSLDPPEGREAAFGFGQLDVETLQKVVTASAGRQVVLIRLLNSAKVLAAEDEKPVAEVLRAALKSGGDEAWDRVVPYISILEMRSLNAELVEALKSRSKTASGACAASALGRMGDKSHIPTLEKAAKCGYVPTERAAKRAIALIKSAK